jgi:error-prone DNA polymerase
VPYAELHAHSNFSFLDGASHPEELVEQAARLDLDALALTDHDGMYGAVRLADAARELGVRTVLGTELSLGLPGPQNGVPDPAGEHLLLLARGVEGYRRLCRAVTSGHLAGQHGTLVPAGNRQPLRSPPDLHRPQQSKLQTIGNAQRSPSLRTPTLPPAPAHRTGAEDNRTQRHRLSVGAVEW